MITLKGTIPEKTLAVYRSHGTQGTPGKGLSDIPIDTPNFKGNRTPKANVLSKYLKKMNGFHWGLFGAPLVAELPDGSRWIYDGGHRVAMLQLVDPDRKTFPGYVVPVKDEAEISRLFHRVNGSAASFVNPETRFINEVLGEELGIEKYTEVLEKSKVVVYEAPDNYVPNSVNPKWKINVKPLQDMVDLDSENAIWSLNLYIKGWEQFTNGSENGIAITGQIVKAKHLLKNVYADEFQDEKILKAFEQWFIDSVRMLPAKESWLFNTEYKHDRMELRHYGTAYGIMQRFCSWARNQTWASKAPKIEKMKIVYNSYDEKKQKRVEEKEAEYA
jgi:hypothetical protein